MFETSSDLLMLSKKLRSLVKHCIRYAESSDAVFWADKLVSLTRDNVEDLYLLCRALFNDKQYKRCTVYIMENCLEVNFPVFRLLAAKCHYELEEWEPALSVLEGGDYSYFSATGKPKIKKGPDKQISDSIDWGMSQSQIKSRIALLLGKVYEAIENRELAEKNFRDALKHDVFCHEAFERLTQHHLLTGQEEQELFNSLMFDEQCPDECVNAIKFLYGCSLKKYNQVVKSELPSNLVEPLVQNLEVKASVAERLFFNNQFHQCYNLTKSILKSEPFFRPAMLLHISVLVELNKGNELFSLAHSLIDFHAECAISWLAVGCYYFLIGRQDPARRYLRRAITIDNMSGPSWLVNAHSFAAESEHDQAMAAYFTAAKLMRGFHLPSLYIGLEYAVTNNLTLAEKFTRESLSVAPDDPNVLHELGVILYKKGEMEQAERVLFAAMQKVDSLQSEVPSQKWQPLFNNLGHVYRACGKYKEAIEYHERALNLNSENASTHASIGLVHCYLGNWSRAISCFHEALSLKREDAFTVAMLKIALATSLSNSLTSDFETVDINKLKAKRLNESNMDDKLQFKIQENQTASERMDDSLTGGNVKQEWSPNQPTAGVTSPRPVFSGDTGTTTQGSRLSTLMDLDYSL